MTGHIELLWAWAGASVGEKVGPTAHIINLWPKAQMNLDTRCRTYTISQNNFMLGSKCLEQLANREHKLV